VKELLARDKAEHGVSQELKPLIRREARVGTGRVRQRGAKQLRLLESVADGGLAFFEDAEVTAGAQFLGHDQAEW
jgi:hypothetical protein